MRLLVLRSTGTCARAASGDLPQRLVTLLVTLALDAGGQAVDLRSIRLGLLLHGVERLLLLLDGRRQVIELRHRRPIVVKKEHEHGSDAGMADEK